MTKQENEAEKIRRRTFCRSYLIYQAEVEEEDPSPRESLRKWALRSKFPHSHLNDLLKALKPWLPDLPADARTLLRAIAIKGSAIGLPPVGNQMSRR
nr:unnamed protein product [Spirometra erinaceieuropaei]